jgi:chemotaxis protein MotB
MNIQRSASLAISLLGSIMSNPRHPKRLVIVKRPVSHDDGHGGQWKVAYADFVTAMMAFFLIMWLLATASQNERAVIARYFSTASIFDLPGGSGVLSGGKAVLNSGESKPEKIVTGVRPRKGREEGDQSSTPESSAKDRLERQRFEAIKAELERMELQGALKTVAAHLSLEVTSEGLRIQIFDRDGEAMFPAGSFEPTPRLVTILGVVSQVLGTVQNSVIVTGHTDAQVLQRATYSNWELSSDRANAVRRQLETGGLGSSRFVSVEGRAATEPLLPQSPADPRNRRIAITILRSDVEQQEHESGRRDGAAPS